MSQLALKPSYNHQYQEQAPKTVLTWDSAYRVYSRLNPYLLIKDESECPGVGWNLGHRSLFHRNGFHHPVKWQVQEQVGWRRLTYQEFCVFYGVKV